MEDGIEEDLLPANTPLEEVVRVTPPLDTADLPPDADEAEAVDEPRLTPRPPKVPLEAVV